MTEQQEILQRRGQLLVELLLGDLRPTFAVDGGDTGYDYLVGFNNRRGGTNLCAVEYITTDRPVHGRHPIARADLDRMAHANVPVLLLVVDTKRDRLYYAWPSDDQPVVARVGRRPSLALAVVDGEAKRKLRQRLVRATPALATVA